MTQEQIAESADLGSRPPQLAYHDGNGKFLRWCDREEWARHQRAYFGDRFEHLAVSDVWLDYLQPDEVEPLLAELNALWRELGQKMKAAGASRAAYEAYKAGGASFETVLEASSEHDYYDLRSKRQLVKRALKELSEGEPDRYRRSTAYGMIRTNIGEYVIELGDLVPAFRRVRERFDAAYDKAHAERRAKIDQTPIDDEAWAKELERRADVDAYLSDNWSRRP